jgi:hypothetical protein
MQRGAIKECSDDSSWVIEDIPNDRMVLKRGMMQDKGD